MRDREGVNPGVIDGYMGDNTEAAIRAALMGPTYKGILPHAIWQGWPQKRQATLYVQALAKSVDIDPGPLDGYWGQRTDDAYEELCLLLKTGKRLELFRDDEQSADASDVSALSTFPVQSESEVVKVYGQPGDDSKQTYVNLPYTMRLSWDLDAQVRRVKCHKLVAPSLVEVLADSYQGCLWYKGDSRAWLRSLWRYA